MEGEMFGTYAMYGRENKCMQSFLEKPGGNLSLKRPRLRKSFNQNFLFFLGL
jgi:hypothetical protein